MRAYDAAIVGAGIIGASIGLELARRGLRVVIFDRRDPGREASWAAAGMLSPAPHFPEDVPLIPLGRASVALYPEFVETVEKLSGRSTDFRRDGALQVFFSADAEAERDRMVAEHRQLGLATEAFPLAELRAMESSLGASAKAAAWLPDEASVDARALTEATLAAASRQGAQIRAGTEVSEVLCEGGRVSGVVTGGEKVAAGRAVVAAGCFSHAIRPLGDFVRTRPVRGQMVSLRPAGILLGRVVRSERAYLVPRSDGRILAGSTLEDAGFERAVTPAGLLRFLAGAVELCPALGNAPIEEIWAGLRPDTPDHSPILGPTDIEGLFLATGHFRNGILLAPITAKLLREQILEGRTTMDTRPFDPLRFAAAKSGTNG